MTISSTTRTAGPFTGNGVAASFPFTFKVFQAADLAVVSLFVASGAERTLDVDADYTVALNANQDANPGGSVTLTAGPLAVGYRLTITTDMPALQGLDLQNFGGFYPDVVNVALDRLTILIQQLQGILNSVPKKMAPLPCAGDSPGNVFVAPLGVVGVLVNGMFQNPADYTLSGDLWEIITLNYTTEPGDRVYALCVTY